MLNEKIDQMAYYFFKNVNFSSRWRAALDPLAGRVFETPVVDESKILLKFADKKQIIERLAWQNV